VWWSTSTVRTPSATPSATCPWCARTALAPRPVAGKAALELVVGAPALGLDDQGHQPGNVLAEPGADFFTAGQLAGWRSLREVRYAGSFEGQTTIAVGVRERVPFRVFTVLDARDQIRRVVLDVAR
jgi:hypothetical protein